MSIPKVPKKTVKTALKSLKDLSIKYDLAGKTASTEEAISKLYDKIIDVQYLNFLKDRIKPTIGKKEEQEAWGNFNRMLDNNKEMRDLDPDDWNALNGTYSDNWIKHWSNSGDGGQQHLKKYGGSIKNVNSSERIPMGGITSAFRHDWSTPVNNTKK